MGKMTTCTRCGNEFERTGNQNWCPSCREEAKKNKSERLALKNEEARQAGKSYGQLKAEEYMKAEAKKILSAEEDAPASWKKQEKETRKVPKKGKSKEKGETMKKTPEETSGPDLKVEVIRGVIKPPVSVRAYINVHIMELKKELEEFEAYRASYSDIPSE